MKIYTRSGDDGTTGLLGGERVAKDAPRVRAYGAVDEANAQLGVARAALDDASMDALLHELQNALFDVGADLAAPEGAPARAHLAAIDAADVTALEGRIDALEAELAPLRRFVLPGGHPAAAALHVARAVVRRAERDVVAAAADDALNPAVARWLNRLSDLLFVAARAVNARAGVGDTPWSPRRPDRGDAEA